MPRDVRIRSHEAELVGVLYERGSELSELAAARGGADRRRSYGDMKARRVALLCHGANWDASGWAEVAPKFVARGVPALALNFRGYDGSTGRTNRQSAVEDVRNAVAWLRMNGAREVALVGASMGGSAVLTASAYIAPECVVSISAPVRAMSEQDAKRIGGRKLFVCAERDSLGAADAVRQAFEQAEEPKSIRFFPGREHSRGMFKSAYAAEVLDAILDFVSAGLATRT